MENEKLEWKIIDSFSEAKNSLSSDNFIRDGGIMIKQKIEYLDSLYSFFIVKKENEQIKQAIFGTVEISPFKRSALYERGLSNEKLLKRILELRAICASDSVFSDRIRQNSFMTTNIKSTLGWSIDGVENYNATDKEILDFMDEYNIPVDEKERQEIEAEFSEKTSVTIRKEQDIEIRSHIHTAYSTYTRNLLELKPKELVAKTEEMYQKSQINQIALKPVLTEALPQKSFNALMHTSYPNEDFKNPFDLLYKTWQKSDFKDDLNTVIKKAAYEMELKANAKGDVNYEQE